MKLKTMRQSSALKKTREFATGLLIFAVTGLPVCSCSGRIHVIPDDDDSRIPVTLRVSSLEQVPFDDAKQTRAVNSEVCSAISFAVYTVNGDSYTRVQNVNQSADDQSFGTVTFRLEEGDYKVLVLAHNGDMSPTTTNPQKIEFNKNKTTTKMTDTFLYWSDLTIAEGTTSFNLDLTRAVAMFQFNLTDAAIPEDVAQLKFYYQGGSSTLDATSGYGCVASKQTEVIDVTPGKNTYEVYTFIRTNSNSLEMTVSALNSEGEVLKEMKFTDVAITKNYKTRYTGEMFGKTAVDGAMTINLNSDWMLGDVVNF